MKKLVASIAAVLLACSVAVGASAAARVGTSASNVSVQYYFPRAGQAPEPQLVSIIKSAKKTCDVAIYSFTDQDIANALIADKKRGVAVRVISDKTESGNKYQKAVLQTLKSAKIPVKVDSHTGIMHLKVTIVDSSVATTGSFNYTKDAETANDEVFVVLRSTTAARDFESEFSNMWADTQHYANY